MILLFVLKVNAKKNKLFHKTHHPSNLNSESEDLNGGGKR